MKYDYLIVGAGLFGATLARELTDAGKKCLVLEKRPFVAGNIYTEKKASIDIHKYGAHIFHTDYKKVWDYVNRFAEFNNYINSPMANYQDEVYSLPFNMITFSKMFNIVTPDEAKEKIDADKPKLNRETENLEEEALSMVGHTIYEKLVKHYTTKQWGREPKDLPKHIIRRLPLRFTYNNNYFNDRYQGIPINGYTAMVENMLKGIEVKLNFDFLNNREIAKEAKKIIYTGSIDEYYDYKFGKLEYRSLRFEEERIEKENYQGVAVFNFCDMRYPYTRIIEHKHFTNADEQFTIITKEYPQEWDIDKERYYPVNNEINNDLYEKYKKYAKKDKNIIWGGRLGLYKYYDMDDTIYAALETAEQLIKEND